MSFNPLNLADMRQWNVAQRPKKRKKQGDKGSNDELELHNSFEVLSDEDAASAENKKMEGIETSQIPERKPKIPPIVIYTHIKDHMKTLQEMQKDLSEKISINCKRDRMIIYTKNENDYTILREKITAAQVSYHTYTLDKDKPVVSILKGLPGNISALEIKDEIEREHSLKVTEVKQFIKKVNTDGVSNEIRIPIYCVKFEKNTKIADVKKIRNLCWCKVHWEKNVPSNLITQCFKCQGFGHIAKNCFRKECCGICAGVHNTLMCLPGSIVKCSNCGGDHRATDSNCEVYMRAASRKQPTKSSSKENFFPNVVPNKYQSTTNTGVSAGVSFASAVRGGKSADQNQNNQKGRSTSTNRDNAGSIGDLLADLKSFFKDFNFQKTIDIVRNTLEKIKNCDDGISKFMCIVEAGIEIFS